MNTEAKLHQLLRWRVARAEAEAPPAPRASRLLELAKPWWETWPERFQALVERLGHIQIGYGHAMAEPLQSRSGHPVPVLLVRTVEEVETSASVLYFALRAGSLRLRIRLENAAEPSEQSFEVTFVCATTSRPLFSAVAVLSVDREYRIDVELPEEIASRWQPLRVTDRMPFRLILRSSSGSE